MGSVARPARFVFIFGVCAALLALLPVSFSPVIRGQVFSALEFPLAVSGAAAEWTRDLLYFHQNAVENRAYRQMLSKERLDQIQAHEIRLENARLSKLLELKPSTMYGMDHIFYSRVIARSPAAWSRTLWIDKGFEDGARENLPVFADENLIGKIIEVRPGAAKVILLTDPSCKIGVLIHRTRQQGVLSGMISGECRLKYIPVDADIKPGDRIETAGLGVFFPKGIPVGEVIRVRKEPGQIYQVADVRPFADPGRAEEVAVLDVR